MTPREFAGLVAAALPRMYTGASPEVLTLDGGRVEVVWRLEEHTFRLVVTREDRPAVVD